MGNVPGMAELTKLESKLGEVLGLSMATQRATKQVEGMLEEGQLLGPTLKRMHDEAKEVRDDATKMMETYLAGEDEALDGFEFLTMAEAGEVGHWSIVGKLNERARNPDVAELVDWALPIQRRHLTAVMDGSLQLAEDEDPNEIEE